MKNQIEWKRESTRGSQCSDPSTTYDLIVDGVLVGYIEAEFESYRVGNCLGREAYRVSGYVPHLLGDRASIDLPEFIVSETMTRCEALRAAKAAILEKI